MRTAVLMLSIGCGSPHEEVEQDSALPSEPSLEDWVVDLSITEHEQVATVLEVRWDQLEATEQIWLEFSFENDEWHPSPPREGLAGERSELILGVPGSTEVQLRLVATVDGDTLTGRIHEAQTGEVPAALALPELIAYTPDLAHSAGYVLGSVDMGPSWYSGPWWLYILDRRARIVWYYEIPDGNCSMFPRVAHDGTHIVFDRTSSYSHFDHGASSTLWRATLDWAWTESLEVPGMGYTWSETDEGSIIHDNRLGEGTVDLMEIWPDGTIETLWACPDESYGNCGVNATNWMEATDTILFSLYGPATVVEIDRQTGTVLHQYGQAEGSYAFDDPSHGFDMQHFPTYTADGTLLVHSHVPTDTSQQRVFEYEIDHEAEQLQLVWEFGEGYPEYATYAGEAVRLDNGNTLINYGSDGGIREVTGGGEVAWEARMPAHHLIGHTELIDSLYDLVEGPEGR